MTIAGKLLTADDLLALPDDGKRYELVRGALIEMPPPGIMHYIVTGRIGHRIGSFVEENELDFFYGPEAAAYIEQQPDTVRAADYALISYDRFTEPIPQRGYVAGVVPDLVVEVISPGYAAAAAATARAQMWLDAGVRLALVAYIAIREIVMHRDDGTTQRFGMDDMLTCEPVLPGFACPVADIFTFGPRRSGENDNDY